MTGRIAHGGRPAVTGTRRRLAGAGERGSALVELSLVLPMLILIMAAGTDFARVFYMSNVLTNAARVGAQFGAQSSSTYTDTAGMQAIAQSVANANLASPTAVITASSLCECYSNAGVSSATSPANNCTYTCPASGHIVIHVTVTAARTQSMIFSGVPGIPASLALTRSVTLRAQ